MNYTYFIIKNNLIFLLIFIALAPYFVWGYYAPLMLLIMFLLFFNILIFKHNINLNKLFYFILIYLVVFLYQCIHSQSYNYFITAIIPVIIASLSRQEVLNIFQIFKKYFTYLLLPGSIIWIIHTITGNNLLFNFYEIPALNNPGKVDLGITYYLNFFSLVPSYDLGKTIYRFCGIFEEPGLIGTVCSLILVSEKFDLKSKQNKLILFYGLISFSLMFYISIFIYLFVLSFKSIDKFLKFISLILILFIFAFYTDVLSDSLVSRVSYGVNGLQIEDNRSNYQLDMMFNNWRSLSSTSLFLFGYENLPQGDYSSIKIIPVNKGILGVFLCLGFLILLILKFSDKNTKKYELFGLIVIFGLSLYQRPGFLEPYFIICFCYALVRLNSGKGNI